MSEHEHAEHLEVLGGLLNSDMVSENAMTWSELDGFMAGIIICPVPILPAEWITHVWGEEGMDVVVDDEQARFMNGLVIGRFKQLLFGLYQGSMHPLYDLGPDGEADWTNWIGGFAQAMQLRPDARTMFGVHDDGLGDEDAEEAMYTLMRLSELAASPAEAEGDEIDEDDAKLLAMAPDLIVEAILLLYGVKQASGVPIPVSLADTGVKIGRNDPCPCGSGENYGDCCMEKDRQKRLEEARLAEGG